jgi:hypothetical protein
MSGGSSDDATLGIAHRDKDARVILDRIVDQGQRPPFDPQRAVERFVAALKDYRIKSITGDSYAGETFRQHFQRLNISYRVSELSTSEVYESFEPILNGDRVVLIDEPTLESQLLGLVWRANKITHPVGEHDDYATGACGALVTASEHKVINPYAVPTGPSVRNPFSLSTFGPRTSGVEQTVSSGYPCPIGVGNSGWSLAGRDDDNFYVGAKPVR